MIGTKDVSLITQYRLKQVHCTNLDAGDASLISKSIRTELAPEFNLDASEDELAGIKTREMISGKMYALDSFSSVNADMDMQDLPEGCDMPAQASDTENGMDTENDEIAMVDDEDMMDEPVDTKISAIQFRAVPVKVQQKDNFQAMTQQEREINPQVGLASKKQLKNLKKKQRRQNNENMVVE